jgi:hypothetical protein
MFALDDFRHAMLNWNRFLTASILVGALLLKTGVPLVAVLLGLGCSALVNRQFRLRTMAGARRRGVRHV